MSFPFTSIKIKFKLIIIWVNHLPNPYVLGYSPKVVGISMVVLVFAYCKKSILSSLFWTSKCFYYPSLVLKFLRVVLSPSIFSFMSITTIYQVDQGNKPQVVFNQLPLVQTRQIHKGK